MEKEKSLGELLTDLVSVTNRTRPGQVTHQISKIEVYVKELLTKQKEEHQEEIKELHIELSGKMTTATSARALHAVFKRYFKRKI